MYKAFEHCYFASTVRKPKLLGMLNAPLPLGHLAQIIIIKKRETNNTKPLKGYKSVGKSLSPLFVILSK